MDQPALTLRLQPTGPACGRHLLATFALLVASAGWTQPTDLAPSVVVLGNGPPDLAYAFGESIAASEDYLYVTGVGPTFTTSHQILAPNLLGGWTPFVSGTVGGFFDTTAPVALVDPIAYRIADSTFDGFLLSRLDLSQIANTGLDWLFRWSPDDLGARLRSLDAGPSQFVDGNLVAVGWESGSTSSFVILRDQQAAVQTFYADAVAGGGAPSVSVDTDQAAIGLPGTNEVITVVAGSPWVQQSVLSGPAGASAFGSSVALRGNLLAVGAPDSTICVLPPNIGCVDSGQVWLYTRVGSIWTFATGLVSPSQGTSGEKIGSSVRFNDDGSRLAAGAPGSSSTLLFARRDNGSWRFLARARSSPSQDDMAGTAVAFGGNNELFVGAPDHDGGPGTGVVGAALVFREGVFADGFEAGDTQDWSQSNP